MFFLCAKIEKALNNSKASAAAVEQIVRRGAGKSKQQVHWQAKRGEISHF